jgi:hypothetical protein
MCQFIINQSIKRKINRRLIREVLYDERLNVSLFVVYYESIKRELKTKPIYECRCDERLKTRVEDSTRLSCTQLVGELEHLKTETGLIDEMFASEMGECVFLM